MRQAIEKATSKLLAIYLSKGVQVSDLAENMFDMEYESFSVNRAKDKTVIALLTFIEVLEDGTQNIHMRYTYSEDQHLISIEQKIGSSRFQLQWRRHAAVASAVSELASALKYAGYSAEKIENAISSLPVDLVPRLRAALKAVA